MDDRHKTKEQLITELEALRAEVAALKQYRRSPSPVPPSPIGLPNYSSLPLGDSSEATQIEADLRQHAKLLDLAYDAIIGQDISGKIIYWNQGAERTYGWKKEEVSQQVTSVLLQTQFPISAEATRTALFEQSYWEGELTQSKRDGEQIIVESRHALMRDAQGNAIAILEINRDITKRKQLEEKLKISEERLRLALELTGIAVWNWNWPTHELIWSDNHFRLWGIELGSVIPSYDVWSRSIHADERERVKQTWQTALATQTAYEVEYRIILPDGNLRWILSKAHTLHDPTTGQPLRSLGVSLDITQLKQLEEKLKISEERLRLALELTEIAIWDMNLLTEELIWNDAHFRLWGMELGTVIPTYDIWYRSIHFDERERVIQIWQTALATQTLYEAEYRIYWPDGSLHWILGKAHTLYDPTTGQPLRSLGVSIDITKRKQVEIALEQLNTELERRITQRTAELVQANYALRQELIQRKKIERELIQREKLLDGFFNAAADSNIGLSILDTDLRFLKLNRTLADANGHSIASHQGQKITEMLPEEVASKILPLLQSIIANQQPISNLELPITRANKPGLVRYWLISCFPIIADGGHLVGVGSMVIEISDRKRIEEQLRQSEANLQIAQKIAHIGSWEWDAVTRKTSWSEELYHIHGYNPDELALEPDETPQIIYPEDLPIYYQQIKEKVLAGQSFTVDSRIVRRDGTIGYIEVRGNPIINEKKELVRLVGTVLDITQRKQTEAILQESDRRWRSLLDNVQLLVISLDRKGNIDYINPFFLHLTQYNQTEILGKNWLNQFLPASQKALIENYFSQIEKNNFHSYYRNPILTKSGEERIIAWNNTRLQDLEGNFMGTISIGEDITEREKLDRMKTEFISVVSHELRTPLTSMQAGLSLLHDKIIDPNSEAGEATIEIANEGVNRLVRLVNDILDLERLESGKVHLQKCAGNTRDLINAAVGEIQEMANQAGIKVEVAPGSFPFYADGDRLVQVLINLLGNAVKFSPKGATIWVSVELQLVEACENFTPENFLLFRVKDCGRGIPAEKLEFIFERFQQLDASDSREKGGTGLGLAISRSIIEQHGGRIWAESVFGQGSTFFFTIPVN